MVKKPSFQFSLKSLLAQLDNHPNNPELLRLVGQKYMDNKKFQKAILYLVQAQEIDPREDFSSHFQLATCYEALHNKSHARTHYIRAFSLAFAKQLTEMKRAVLSVPFSEAFLEKIQQYIKILHFLEILQEPTQLKALFGLSSEEMDEHLMFLRVLSVYLRFGYEHIDFWLYHAAIAQDFEDYAALVESYHKLMEFEPDNYEWLTGLSYAYYEAGELAQAIEHALDATEIYPDEPECWHMLGDLYLFDDREPEAYLAYKKASELDPTDEQCLLDVAETTPDLNEKKAYLLRILKLSPEHVEALYLLGEYYSEVKEFKQALKYYKKAYQLDELEPLYVMALADCYEELHDIDKALRYYVLFLKYEPNDEFVLFKAALIYLQKERENKAIPLLLKLTEQAPEQVFYFTLLAHAYIKLNRLKEAERLLLRLIQKEQSDFVPYLLLSYLYSQQPQLGADFVFFYEKAVSKMSEEDRKTLNLPFIPKGKATPSNLSIDFSKIDLQTLYAAQIDAYQEQNEQSLSELANDFQHFFNPSKDKKIH